MRNAELKTLWRRKLVELINNAINWVIPLVHMVVTYGVFTIVQRQELTASIVFSSMAGFDMLRQQIFMVTHFVPALIQAKVSLKRLQDFLVETELLDEFSHTEEAQAVTINPNQDKIGMSAASFMWSASDTGLNSSTFCGSQTPEKGRFRLCVEDELTFHKGEINLIVGPTGSGKTSLLMALLGEMHYLPNGPGSWVNLPREDGLAYASQESWVQNETIRDNILFGAEYDAERYKQVIYQCGLKRDLSLFDAGDKTEVGEKGLTLSGGQKARITLARAVYSSAQTLLLDDILAALDVHTSKWIIEKCLQGSLIRGRTVILVTHNVALAAPVASFVVALGSDGRILSQGSVSDAVARDSRLAKAMDKEVKAIKANAEEVNLDEVVQDDDKNTRGKLVVEEEIAEGHVSWDSFKLFIRSAGGSWTWLFWVTFVVLKTMANSVDSGETWWLGYWARQYTVHEGHPEKVDAL
jgi:ABC-type multidrug transport system fused ATPase/permease subunit